MLGVLTLNALKGEGRGGEGRGGEGREKGKGGREEGEGGRRGEMAYFSLLVNTRTPFGL